LEETLSDISSLLGFEIQLKPEQRKCIINLLRGEDVIVTLPTYGIQKKFDLSIIHYRQIGKACYMPAQAGVEYFL
jgi:hypothetical protein